jgi:molybdenum cofactor synthesis domain-containing protein
MADELKIRTAVLTISTRGSKGEQPDTSGELIKELIRGIGGEVVDYQIIPDDKKEIMWHLKRMAEALKADLILTTGGTGLSPTDVTPEATLEVIHRRAPGFEEVMRRTGMEHTPHAMLSRAVAGTLEKSLIINLPGSPKGVRENFVAILPALPHGVRILRGDLVKDREHGFKSP